jgi:hypothetical protein
MRLFTGFPVGEPFPNAATALSHSNGTSFPETILCDRLILFESRLAPEGATYFSLGEYQLGR